MKILFVCNSIYAKGNGLAVSARATVDYLRRKGLDVKVLSMENTELGGPQPEFPLKPFYIPLFQKLIVNQGFAFASSDMKVLREAVEWADVIHLEEAFVLEWRVANLARKMGKPCVATFHLHPENILSSIAFGKVRWINDWLLRQFQRFVFDKCVAMQCPSKSVYDRLEKAGFKAKLYLIPNGISLEGDHHQGVPQTDPYLITCVGRLSNEKDQYTLIRAMQYSRHRDNIQLHFAGKGPCAKKMKKMAHKLYTGGVVKYDPIFAFHTAAELTELARKAYLIVHCAIFEVEGLSLPEALREGAVPVIAECELSATSQFALDERSKFPAEDARALAEKIDWWIEHPEARAEMAPKYMASIDKYEIHKSMDMLEEMYKSVIAK